jgi:SAM-dependent methyltransferase
MCDMDDHRQGRRFGAASYRRPEGLTGMRAGLVGRPRAKSIRYQRPGLPKNGQWFGPLVSDYSRIAAHYDATRDVPEDRLAACYDRLIAQAGFPSAGRILDAGSGTGQISLVLAARGYQVLGIDISAAMTALARAKLRPGWAADYIVGDVRAIPAPDAHFDAAVVSKLFQHVEDWRDACRELIRVVRPGGCIAQINERGAFSNTVRRHFARLADEAGYGNRYEGLNPRGGNELEAFMTGQGCRRLAVDTTDLNWQAAITYGEAYRRLRAGMFAEFWRLSDAVHDALLAQTWNWIEAQPEGAATTDRLTPYLVVEIYRTPERPEPGSRDAR